MRRILQFHDWQAKIWQERADRVEASSGAHAYAMRQKHSRQTLASTCTDAWRNVEQYMALGEGVALAGESLAEASLSRMTQEGAI